MRAAAVTMVGISVALLGAGTLPGRAADGNPADTMLDRARQAVRTHEFRGAIRLTWRDDDGRHTRTIAVTAAGGELRMDDGAVVAHDGRAWLRVGKSWSAVWTDAHDPRAPAITSKYRIRTFAGRPVLGRPTVAVSIRHDGHTVERLLFDREIGIVLRRDRLDDDGRLEERAEFVALSGIAPRTGTAMKTPTAAGDAPRALTALPAEAARRVGDGFVLVGAQRVGAQTQLQYTDGVFDASVFTRDGTMDWDALPHGGTDVRIDGQRVRRYRTGGDTVLAWQSRGRTLTCVTDAPAADQSAIVETLSSEDDDAWTDVARFVSGPFAWS